MIENLNLATKAEIQNEMESLEKDYQEKEKELKEAFEEMRSYVQEMDKSMRELHDRYALLKGEMDKREGKNK